MTMSFQDALVKVVEGDVRVPREPRSENILVGAELKKERAID